MIRSLEVSSDTVLASVLILHTLEGLYVEAGLSQMQLQAQERVPIPYTCLNSTVY